MAEMFPRGGIGIGFNCRGRFGDFDGLVNVKLHRFSFMASLVLKKK